MSKDIFIDYRGPLEGADPVIETAMDYALGKILNGAPGEIDIKFDIYGIKFTMQYDKDAKGYYISWIFDNSADASFVLEGLPAEKQDDGTFRVYSSI